MDTDRLLRELTDFLRIPSVSTLPAHNADCRAAAEWVAGELRRLGCREVQFLASGTHPVVWGVGPDVPGAPTLLLYGHYDVQPPDPLEEWTTPPFEPTVRQGHLFGRGTSDNKGNLTARLQAIEAYKATVGPLPLVVRVLFEGEEEIGSAHLAEFTRTHADRLRADGCIWEAGYKDAAGRPTVSLGLKGICYVDLTVRGTTQDAHSSVGGIVPNAAWRLTWALASLKNERDEITVDGLMDHVRRPSAADLAVLERLPWDESDFKKIYGIDRFVAGLTGTALKRRYFLEPTCTICGLSSGYQGEGSKTVLPAVAGAKLDFRLVPDLEPELVRALLRKHLDARGFSDVEITPHHGERPSRWPADSEVAKAAVAANRAAYGVEPVVYP